MSRRPRYITRTVSKALYFPQINTVNSNVDTVKAPNSERVCGNLNCMRREAVLWRRDPSGNGWLCNACSIHLRLLGHHRPLKTCLKSKGGLSISNIINDSGSNNSIYRINGNDGSGNINSVNRINGSRSVSSNDDTSKINGNDDVSRVSGSGNVNGVDGKENISSREQRILPENNDTKKSSNKRLYSEDNLTSSYRKEQKISKNNDTKSKKSHSEDKDNAMTSEHDNKGPDTDDNDNKLRCPWNNKEYMKNGFYSIDLKRDESSMTTAKATYRTRGSIKKEMQLLDNFPKSYLPLPTNYGKIITKEKKNFELPWNLIKEYELGLTKRSPPPYIKIQMNLFIQRKRKHEEPVVCQCVVPSDGGMGCNEDCHNRAMCYECSPKHCILGDKCSNQRFQRKECVKVLRVFETHGKGFGLKTLNFIRKGQLILEYRGEVITQDMAKERIEGVYKNKIHSYFLEYEKGEVLDGTERGTDARRAPNGELFVGVFASVNVPAGTELTYDYNFSTFAGAEALQCHCGSSNCRGILGSKKSQNKKINLSHKKE
ncbi:15071_t:CDS:2 [Entrophospora sp. SA101]|nr:15071_t:CDS:2 [Entrophospora sp. SA101]